jgi:hypothetical protein
MWRRSGAWSGGHLRRLTARGNSVPHPPAAAAAGQSRDARFRAAIPLPVAGTISAAARGVPLPGVDQVAVLASHRANAEWASARVAASSSARV